MWLVVWVGRLCDDHKRAHFPGLQWAVEEPEMYWNVFTIASSLLLLPNGLTALCGRASSLRLPLLIIAFPCSIITRGWLPHFPSRASARTRRNASDKPEAAPRVAAGVADRPSCRSMGRYVLLSNRTLSLPHPSALSLCLALSRISLVCMYVCMPGTVVLPFPALASRSSSTTFVATCLDCWLNCRASW